MNNDIRLKIALFSSGDLGYAVAFANAITTYCRVDLYFSRYYAIKKDLSLLDALDPRVNWFSYSDYRIRDIRNLAAALRVILQIKNKEYDLLHFNGPGSIWLHFFLPLISGKKIVFTLHDPAQHQGLRKWNRNYQDFLQQRLIRKAGKIVVLGKKLQEDFSLRYGEQYRQKTEIIPHGNLDFYNNFGAKPSKNNQDNCPVVLLFGNIRPNKGLEYLAKAEPFISKQIKNYKIVIAGKFDQSFNGSYRYLLDSMKQSRMFEVHDTFIPNSEIASYFSRASIVVLPYTSATQSGIIPLAYSFGKPVVATKVGAIPEIVADGVTGILVEPCDEKQLADALVSLLQNPPTSQQMGKAALHYSQTKLSWDTIAKKTAGIYRELINA